MEYMIENRNAVVLMECATYKMQPGDGTRYNFFLSKLEDTDEIGSIFSGVGDGDGYALVCIYMPGGCGIGIASIWELKNSPKTIFGYLKSHGMGDVNDYTLMAVILAAGILIDHPLELEMAAGAMRKVPDILF